MAQERPTGSNTYLVESYWPGITESRAVLTMSRVQQAVAELAAAGARIRYLTSFFVGEDEAAFCLFESSSAGTIEQACRQAEFPFDRILSVVEIIQP